MSGSTIRRTAVVVFILGSVVFWVWAFSPLAPDDNPDRIPDREFPVAAETACSAALDDLDVIASSVLDLTDPTDRAGIVDDGTDRLERLVATLDELATTTYGELEAGVTDQTRVEELDEWRDVIDRWLRDWDVYLGDRRTHADRLRAEGDVELLLTLVDNVDVAERLTGFARVNDMESCGIPGDL